MLTTVNFSCGHVAEVNLSNNEQKRIEKIAELELNGLCPECRKAEWEKRDNENSVGCACVRTSVDLYKDKFSYCKERLTGYPKENGFTYIFVPIEDIIVETYRKYIDVHDVPFEEMTTLVKNKFSEKYPEYFNKLQPIAVEEPEVAPVPAPAPAPVEVKQPVLEEPVINNGRASVEAPVAVPVDIDPYEMISVAYPETRKAEPVFVQEEVIENPKEEDEFDKILNAELDAEFDAISDKDLEAEISDDFIDDIFNELDDITAEPVKEQPVVVDTEIIEKPVSKPAPTVVDDDPYANMLSDIPEVTSFDAIKNTDDDDEDNNLNNNSNTDNSDNIDSELDALLGDLF